MLKGDVTKEKIKNVSRTLLHKNGYNNTSINDILEASGVKKGSLYFHYQSKETLISEVLEETLGIYENLVDFSIEQPTNTEKIYAIMDAVTHYHTYGDSIHGCMFGNLALEIGHDDSETSLFVQKVFKKWVKRFEKLLENAAANGELKLKEPAEILAKMIVASMEGGVLLSKITNDGQNLRNCTDFVKAIIEERRINPQPR